MFVQKLHPVAETNTLVQEMRLSFSLLDQRMKMLPTLEMNMNQVAEKRRQGMSQHKSFPARCRSEHELILKHNSTKLQNMISIHYSQKNKRHIKYSSSSDQTNSYFSWK